MMTRCVYTNFPNIQSHGTYNGHSPNWSQAIDFFMPSGCTYRNGRAVTRSSVDLVVGKRLTRYLIINANKVGLDYLIFQDHIRNPDERAGERYWRRVSQWRQDNYNNGDCVNTHFDHVHASIYSGGWAASRVPALNPDGKPLVIQGRWGSGPTGGARRRTWPTVEVRGNHSDRNGHDSGTERLHHSVVWLLPRSSSGNSTPRGSHTWRSTSNRSRVRLPSSSRSTAETRRSRRWSSPTGPR